MPFDATGSFKYNDRQDIVLSEIVGACRVLALRLDALSRIAARARHDRHRIIVDGEDMLASATIADLLRPCERRRAVFYDIAVVIGGSVLIGLCAQVKVLLPFSPVPVTGQTFAVLMIGTLLGPWRGSLSVLTYIVQGVAGLPVFAMGGGFAVLRGFTGGYLIGFIPAAYITGFLAQKGWDRRIATTVLAMILGNIVIYAFGLLWLCCLTGISRAVPAVGLYPFVVGDLLKIALAAAVLPAGWKLLEFGGIADKKE